MRYFFTRFLLLLGVFLLVVPTISKGVALEKNNLLYHILVAEFAGRRQQIPIAVEYYRKAAEETRNLEVAERATHIALFSEDTEKALETAQLWLELDKNSIDANRIVAALFIRGNRIREAITPIKKLMSLMLNKPREAWLQTVSQLHVESGGGETLVEILKKLIYPLGERRPELPLSIAFLLMNTQPEEAEVYTEKALALDPAWEQPILLKTKLLINNKKPKEALSFLEKALKTHLREGGDEVRRAYGYLLLEVKEYTKAEHEFLILSKKSQPNADILFALALIKSNQKDYKTAEEYLSQVDKLVPGSPNVQFYRGYIEEQQQKFDEAIASYTSVLEGDNYFVAQLQAAHLLARQNKWAEALAHLKTIRAETPEEEIQLFTTQAGLLSAAGKGEEAIELLNSVEQKYKNNTELLYARALVATRLHRLESVEQDLRKILSKEPKNALALNALGYTLADQTARLDEARQLISAALAIEPENPAILDSMGWVYYRLGDLKQALSYLEKAYSLDKEGEIAAHLGEVLFASTQTEKARALLKEAIRRDPDHPLLKQVIQKFMP